MTEPLLLLVATIGGGLFGFVADRLAARWPDHEEPTDEDDAAARPADDAAARPADDAGARPAAPRGLDWRTAILILNGALIFPALLLRWPEPTDLLVLGLFAAALIVLLATDLDQKLLPNLITLSLIAYAAVLLVAGWSPLLAGKEAALFSGVAAGIGAPVLLFVSDRVLRGALGMGDLWLAVSIGLMAGVTRMFAGFLVASVAFALVLLLLIAARRIGLRTAIPFGPVLIGAAFVAMLLDF